MNLKDMRLESGLKAKKVAENLNISRRQLINLENKIYRLSDDKIEKLAKLYNKKSLKLERWQNNEKRRINFLRTIKEGDVNGIGYEEDRKIFN